MPVTALALPPDARVTALRGLVALLRNDPDLRRVVRGWSVWDGSTGEGNPPSTNQVPWVRITASPEASGWAHNSGEPILRQPIRLAIDTLVAGTSLDNSILLWSAIERAIFRGGVQSLHAIGITGAEVLQPGWGTVDADSQTVSGSGVIRLDVYVAAGGV